MEILTWYCSATKSAPKSSKQAFGNISLKSNLEMEACEVLNLHLLDQAIFSVFISSWR